MRIVAERSWYGTAEGYRVPERHPAARFLIVAAGCEIDEAMLNRYPVLEDLCVKAIDRPPENKAIEMPPKRKRGRPPKKKLFEEPE
jgi:hypothetical protein